MADKNNYKIDKNDKDHLLVTKKVEEKGEGVTTRTSFNLRDEIEEILLITKGPRFKRKLTKKESKIVNVHCSV